MYKAQSTKFKTQSSHSFEICFIKYVSATQNPGRIESALQGRHFLQVLFPKEFAQVLSLEFADAVLRGNRAAHLHCMAHELPIDLPSLLCLDIITRQNINVNVIVANVSEDRVTELARLQQSLIKGKHAGELIVRH